MKKIAIFRTGRHTSHQGDELTVTPEMLREVVSAYNPKEHEAPAVVGHPKLNGPAYGWVTALSFSETDGVLYADFAQVEKQFEQLLKDGRFKKRSASFWAPENESNPTKGKWHLRHVGFLGAQPPAIKGLKDFADDADCPVYEFSELPTNSNEEIMPKENIPDATPKKDEQAGQTAEFAERETALTAKEQALNAREAKVAADEKALADAKGATQKKGFTDFADTLIAHGKISPAEKDAIVSAFIDVDNADKSFDFAEDGKVAKKTGIEALQVVLERLAPAVDFAERSGTDPNNAGKPQHGEDSSDIELYKEIQEYAEKHEITFEEAIDLISAGS